MPRPISYAVFCLHTSGLHKRARWPDCSLPNSPPAAAPLAYPPSPLASPALPVGLSFFFNDTATTEIYTLSLHDALPISPDPLRPPGSDKRLPAVAARASRTGTPHSDALHSDAPHSQAPHSDAPPSHAPPPPPR